MAILRFRICWEEDDQTYCDIEIDGSQTFYDFHLCIMKSFELDSSKVAAMKAKAVKDMETTIEKVQKDPDPQINAMFKNIWAVK